MDGHNIPPLLVTSRLVGAALFYSKCMMIYSLEKCLEYQQYDFLKQFAKNAPYLLLIYHSSGVDIRRGKN